MSNEQPRPWRIAQPIGGMSFPELERYTRSDDWDILDDTEVATEEEALDLITELQAHPEGASGWYATWQMGEDYVTTIITPLADAEEAQ